MKKSIILLRTAGTICLLFALFHLMFHFLFQWGVTLSCLDSVNRAILMTYHYISILIFGYMGYMSLLQTRKVLASNLKRSILGFFGLLFVVRIVTEFTHFGLTAFSAVIIALCIAPVVLFGLVAKKVYDG